VVPGGEQVLTEDRADVASGASYKDFHAFTFASRSVADLC